MGDERSTQSFAGRGNGEGAGPKGDDVPTRSMGPGGAGQIREASQPPPARVGEIDLSRELGRGGMGSVWFGHDTLLGRDVAVKFLHHAASSPDDPDFAAFIRSTRLAAQVRSPRLTQVLSAGVQDGVPYIVMEYSPGVPLSTLLRDRAKFTLPLALAIMEAVSEGAADLHEAGVVHRDLKPANVLVEPGGRVVVTDFGLAVSRPREQIAGSAPGYGGTPAYMAPELFDGNATYQSDVYALGVMLFELLTGEPPFTGSFAEVASAHRDAAAPLGRLPADTPEPVRDLIARATEKSLRLRSKSGRHFLDALRRAVPDEGPWTRGRAELGVLVGRGVAPAPQPRPPAGSSFYDALHAMSSSRARARTEKENEEPLIIAPTPEVGERPPRVLTGLGCVGCGYDLRGLELDGACPECATPVAESTNPERLVFADRTWLRIVNAGVLVSVFLLWQIGALLAARREPGSAVRRAAHGARDWVSVARVTVVWCGAIGSLVLPMAIFSPLLPERFEGVPGHVNWAIGVVYSAAWAVWTGDLARRGSRVPRRSAGKSGAVRAMRRRTQRPPLAPLVTQAVAVAVLSGAIIALEVSGEDWRSPSSIGAWASMLLTIVGFSSLAVAWGRSIHVHRALSAARRGLLNRERLVGVSGASPLDGRSLRVGIAPDAAVAVGHRAVACIGCAYDLTSLEPGAACPECATPIQETTDPERLIYADEAWLRSVTRGMMLLYSAPGMILAGPIVFGIVAGLSARKGEDPSKAVSPEGMAWAGIACMILSGYIGVWLATRRETRPSDPTRRSPWIERSRRTARWSALLSFGITAVAAWQVRSGDAQSVLSFALAGAVVLVVAQFPWAVWVHDVLRRSECVAPRRAGSAEAARAVLKRRRRGPAGTLIIIAVANVLVAAVTAYYWHSALPTTAVGPFESAMVFPVLAAGALAPLTMWGLGARAYRRVCRVLEHRIDRSALFGGM